MEAARKIGTSEDPTWISIYAAIFTSLLCLLYRPPGLWGILHGGGWVVVILLNCKNGTAKENQGTGG